jgi:cysteine synthase A
MALQVYDNLLNLIGNTPLLKLKRITGEHQAEVYAKLEFLNPGGSIKDRAALGMVLAAEEEGKLKKGFTIIEPTSGNTGIGLALIACLRGYRSIIVMPKKYSQEKMKLVKALGAELELTATEDGMEGAIKRAEELNREIPNSFLPNQFYNLANPDYHYQTTGPEIYQQMEGRIDAAVIGVGTGGTFTGVAHYLKEKIPQVLAVAVQPEGSILDGGTYKSHKVEGIGIDFYSPTLDLDLIDKVITVPDDDCFATARLLAGKEGLLVGGSSGASVFGALRIAEDLGKGKRVVTILPDGAERYLSKGIFE